MLPVSRPQFLRGHLAVIFAVSLFLLPFVAGCAEWFRPPDPISGIHPETQPSTQAAATQNQAYALELAAAKPRDPFVGQGDEIEITVFRHDEMLRHILIPPSKVINYPLVGDIDVHDMTTDDLRRAVVAGLAQYVKDPQVSVRMLVSRSENLLILGEVKMPGQYDLLGAMNALQAVTRAGGFTADARRQIVLIRPGPQKTQAYILDLGRALTEADLRANVQLASGDIVYVPLSTAASVDRFAQHISNWLQPVLDVESAVVLGQAINHDFSNRGNTTNINVVTH